MKPANHVLLVLLWMLTCTAFAQPVINNQPLTSTNVVGDTVSFSVNVSGSAPLVYQWLKNGTNLLNGNFIPVRARVTGATTPMLTLTQVTTNDQANYACWITNSSGSVTSSVASLTVIVPPTIAVQPKNINTNSGAQVKFSVTAAGTPPFAYQWYKNNALISSATLSSYTVSGLTTNDSGSLFKVQVSNLAGSIFSSNAVLNVGIAPAFVKTPVSLLITQGQPAIFSVTANGTPLNYYWHRNGLVLADGTNSSYTIASVVVTNAGTYGCLISNYLGSVNASATLTVAYPPVIKVQPTNQIIGVGSNFTVSVTAAGYPKLAYQWFTNSLPIIGATNAVYAVTDAQISDAGDYSVEVTNSLGSVTSSVANVSILYYSPTIIVPPQSANVPVGSNCTLGVTATGTAPLSWQWRFNSMPISGATTQTYAFGPVQLTDAGQYDVVITNIAGSITSSVANINIGYMPVIVQHPLSVTNNLGDSVAFSCVATGSAPVSLQWTLDGYAIDGATNSDLSLVSVQATNIGNYALTATNLFGSATSSNAALNLIGYNFTEWSGLVAWWPLHGDALDASGYGNNGTNIGAVVAATDRFGNTNGAMHFNGRNACIQCPPGAYFGTNFTISAWVNETAYQNWSRVLDFGNGSAAENTLLAVSFSNSGHPDLEAYVGTTARIGPSESATALSLNQWVQLVATWNGLQITYYYNGTNMGVFNTLLNRDSVVTTLNYIGRSNWRANGDLDFAGSMDDVRIYNHALSTNEVAELYAMESQTTPLPQQNLSAQVISGTNVELNLMTGQAGGNYLLQCATNLTFPIQWQTIATNSADTNGALQFIDSPAGNSQKFYRVVTP